MKSTSEGTEREWSHRGARMHRGSGLTGVQEEWSHRGARMHRGSGLTGVQECIGGVVSQGCKNA